MMDTFIVPRLAPGEQLRVRGDDLAAGLSEKGQVGAAPHARG